MTEEKKTQISKDISIEKYKVLKECLINGEHIVVYEVFKISDNKATFIMHKVVGLNPLDGNETRVSLQTVERIGDSITHKVDKFIIDKVIDHFGDILAKIWYNEGIVKSVLTFEEINLDIVSPDRLRSFLNHVVASRE